MRPRWQGGKEPRELADEGIEVWAKIPDASRYAVSNMGRVGSSAQGPWKLMTLSTHGAGYRSVGIVDDVGKSTTHLVHRLVVLSFDGPPPTPQHTGVRHLDGDKGNNVLSNLLHGTKSSNMLDVLRHRQEQEEVVRDALIEETKAAGTWYGGRSWDTELVGKVMALERSGHLTGAQAADLLGVTTHVVANIARSNSHTHIRVPRVKKQKRRSKARKDAIMVLIREGKNAAQINEVLGETLTPQAVTYYRSKARHE
jgi:hypothetical protein